MDVNIIGPKVTLTSSALKGLACGEVLLEKKVSPYSYWSQSKVNEMYPDLEHVVQNGKDVAGSFNASKTKMVSIITIRQILAFIKL